MSGRQTFLVSLALVLATATGKLSSEGAVAAFRVNREAAAAHAFSAGTLRRNLPYGSASGEPLLLDAYLPAGNGRHPAIVFVHGGGFRSGDKSAFAPTEETFAATGEALTRHGYAVFSINYRLAPRFRFPAAELDVERALRWIRARARELRVDPTRLALFGASAGGNLAVLAAVEGRGPLGRGLRVRAAVSWSGPMDLARFYTEHPFVSDYLGCAPATCPGRYRAASPVAYVDRGDPPVLLANGSAEIVPLTQAREMARALAAASVRHQLVVVSGSRHAGQYRRDVWATTLRFLERSLRP